ncbi:8 TM domain-containing transmembrane protein [Acrasis kona]|uniref:8 TM domain-containing transmembrane protein n=1 Tax=Acrasis kona TaxID=1008807 RepID=A0AAW2Z9P2_9EUKA
MDENTPLVQNEGLQINTPLPASLETTLNILEPTDQKRINREQRAEFLRPFRHLVTIGTQRIRFYFWCSYSCYLLFLFSLLAIMFVMSLYLDHFISFRTFYLRSLPGLVLLNIVSYLIQIIIVMFDPLYKKKKEIIEAISRVGGFIEDIFISNDEVKTLQRLYLVSFFSIPLTLGCYLMHSLFFPHKLYIVSFCPVLVYIPSYIVLFIFYGKSYKENPPDLMSLSERWGDFKEYGMSHVIGSIFNVLIGFQIFFLCLKFDGYLVNWIAYLLPLFLILLFLACVGSCCSELSSEYIFYIPFVLLTVFAVLMELKSRNSINTEYIMIFAPLEIIIAIMMALSVFYRRSFPGYGDKKTVSNKLRMGIPYHIRVRYNKQKCRMRENKT